MSLWSRGSFKYAQKHQTTHQTDTQIGGAGQNFSDFTLIAKKFPDIVHNLNYVAENIWDQI